MIEQYLSNTNESVTVFILQKKEKKELNKVEMMTPHLQSYLLVCYSFEGRLFAGALVACWRCIMLSLLLLLSL